MEDAGFDLQKLFDDTERPIRKGEPVCGELPLRQRRADGISLDSENASGNRPHLQRWVASSPLVNTLGSYRGLMQIGTRSGTRNYASK